MTQLSDEELVGKAVESAGSPRRQNEFLDELFGRYYRKVAIWCYRYAGDRERAADWTQEIFLRVQRNLSSFAGNARFSTWLFTIARNHCLNSIKQIKHAGSIEDGEFAAPRAEEFESMLDRERREEQAREWIYTLLDDTERQVFTLHYSEELPLASITSLLGLTNSSGAKAYIVSARRKLQEAVRRWNARSKSDVPG